MMKAYLYPISSFIDQDSPNEYIESFMDCLEGQITFVNRHRPSKKGIIDYILYFKNTNLLFLNWIEDLPDKRGGLVQGLFFVFLVYLVKLWGKKIIYVLHNKQSHYRSKRVLKGFLFNLVLKRSDLIVTHSKEGIRYLKNRGVDVVSKAGYFVHPLEKKELPALECKKYDILIWGSIIPYKGIDTFLRFLHERELESKYQILLAGKIKPADYEVEINQYCNDHIHLDNRFIPQEELEEFMASSRAVLFTYSEESVLSSGALMESLAYELNIIAPHVGAFRDVQEEGLIHTYKDFDDLIRHLDNFLSAERDLSKQIDRFIRENDWSQFSKWLMDRIHSIPLHHR